MVEQRRVSKLSLWTESRIVYESKDSNTPTIKDVLKGDIEILVSRKNAFKVLRKEFDLDQTVNIELYHLPEDISRDLNDVWKRIETLLYNCD